MKNDLLTECNDQRISEVEFTSIFCKRCKNKSCDRAGWASSNWEERMSTQAERLLHNPNIVKQSESSRWEGLVNLESLEITGDTEVWGKASIKVKEYELETIEPLPKINLKPQEKPKTIEKPKKPTVQTAKRFVNTPPQDILIAGVDQPKQQPVDEWAVPPKKLNVGGTFKMGGG
jgi:hypothetical protein